MQAVVDVMAASPFLTRTCVTDPMALNVLADLGRPVEPLRPLSRWKALEILRIAALDLAGSVPLETVGRALADLADGLLRAATADVGLDEQLAVIGMGKLGARELNYGSDIDILFVGGADPQPLLALVRQAWRTDVALRPEGRAGPLVRSLGSYSAYWDRWAQTWEFQALLKARPAAGNPEIGAAFAREAAKRVWGRPLGVDDLRSLRTMKSRAEQVVSRQGLSRREIKLGYGGIRDIEFAVQLLQLVHGRQDSSLRAPPPWTPSLLWPAAATWANPTPPAWRPRTGSCGRSSTGCSCSRTARSMPCLPVAPPGHTWRGSWATGTGRPPPHWPGSRPTWAAIRQR